MQGGKYHVVNKEADGSNSRISDTCLESVVVCDLFKYMELRAATVATESLLNFRLFISPPLLRDLNCLGLLPSPSVRHLVAAVFPCFMRRFKVAHLKVDPGDDTWEHKARQKFVFATDAWSEQVQLFIRTYGMLPYRARVTDDRENVTVKFYE